MGRAAAKCRKMCIRDRKYAAGSITKEAYIQQKAAADVKIAENDEAIQRSHERMKAVSYTHLDVYKRQVSSSARSRLTAT